jgi:hypothetical protein
VKATITTRTAARGTNRHTSSVSGETSSAAIAGTRKPELHVTTNAAEAATVTATGSIPICLLICSTIQVGIVDA